MNATNGRRIGEALHPGPADFLTVGTTNPGGLRGKELLAVEQGSGIWSYAETQLSAVTQTSTAKSMKWHAGQAGRHLRVYYGAPAPLRSGSTWAGSCDFPSKKLQVEWPNELWQSGRILATQHYVSGHSVTVLSFYGLPRGPTWPKAATLTNDFLDFFDQRVHHWPLWHCHHSRGLQLWSQRTALL